MAHTTLPVPTVVRNSFEPLNPDPENFNKKRSKTLFLVIFSINSSVADP
jgi:hypothetical protein